MKKVEKANTIYFDNDKEFTEYCVDHNIKCEKDKDGQYFYDWNFSSMYNNDLANDTFHVIKDPKSRIFATQTVDFKGICKPVNVCTFDITDKMILDELKDDGYSCAAPIGTEL